MVRIFRVTIPGSTIALLLAETVLFYAAFILAAILTVEIPTDIFLLYEGGLARITVAVGSLLLAFYFQDLYSSAPTRSNVLLLQQVSLGLGLSFLVQALLGYISLEWIMPRWVMLIGGCIILVAAPVQRRVFGNIVLSQAAAAKVLFLGDNDHVRALGASLCRRPEFGLNVCGYLSDEPERLPGQGMGPCLGRISEVRRVVEDVKPDRIVVGLSERRGVLPVYDLLDLRLLSGVLVEDAAALYETVFGRVPVASLRPSHLIFSSELGPRRQSVMLQSLYSMAIAVLGLLVCLPLMLLISILIRLTSPGPVLYRQPRVGKNGQVFTLYKFRSMRADAEASTGAVWAVKDDPRVTPVGRWLRRLRLDEIPQFFNVLRGEMSLVGPRPERPEFVEQLSKAIPFYRQRLCVKPGITGWAQINHKYTDSIEDTVVKLEYDLYYIKNLAPSLDFYILFSTLKVVLLSRGAQ